MTKKSAGYEEDNVKKRRSQKLLGKRSFFTEQEREAALQLLQLSFDYYNPRKQTNDVKRLILPQNEEKKKDESVALGKAAAGGNCIIGLVASPSSSCSTITRTSAKDFGTSSSWTGGDDHRACSKSRTPVGKSKNKFRSILDIYNHTNPMETT